jgi:dihydrofolate reductase
MRVILIAAVSADGFISRGGGVPWELASDRAHFRRLTAGKTLLLGRRTFDEMLGWFRDHAPLVLTGRVLPEPWEGAGVSSVAEALARTEGAGASELWVCGGGSVYGAALPVATDLILTEVHESLGGGVAFPEVDPAAWRVVRREAGSCEEVGLSWDWVWYERLEDSAVAKISD